MLMRGDIKRLRLMDWQKGKDCEIYEKYPVENRLCVVSTGMNVIVWRKHP